MEFEQWEKYYTEILYDFGFSRKDDEASALILKELLQQIDTLPLTDLKGLIENKDVSIVGNSPSLSVELAERKLKGTIIAADDAVSTLIKRGLHPHIIVTDLDGNIEDILRANQESSIVLIHAHGDNKDAILRYVPLFKHNVMGTTQSKPFDQIHNFGGFTDGDRAVFLADHFHARKIELLGFDFENINTNKDKVTKKRKLDWAYVLIQSLNNPNITLLSPSSSSKSVS